MKNTLWILLQNEPGALLRVAGLFAARQINIDALTVAATHDPAVSQVTLVLRASAGSLDQIQRQLCKLVDVLDAGTLSLIGQDDPQRCMAGVIA
ncbi:MAG: acetolactate synthase small subunit [Proteobacteria bacterium]|nr:acetolactate synthase small subunit [Pseudomonadota bacterium]